MQISTIEKKGNKISFLIKKPDLAFINSLRRLIIDEVPTMAIEDVEFRKNDSVLYDEMVALRLGLIPLYTDLKSYNLPEKCTCNGEGCAKCQCEFSLKTKAAGNIDASKMKSKDPKVVPVYDAMPITRLINNQELEFVAKACLGRGKVHAKWSPGLAWFKNKPEISFKGGPCDRCEESLKLFRQNIVQIKNGKLVVDEEKLQASQYFDVFEDLCPDHIKFSMKEDEYVFNVESWGQLKPKQIVERAVEELLEKLDEFEKLIK